jgi:hypothetical protein
MAEVPAIYIDDLSPKAVDVPGDEVPVKIISAVELQRLGRHLGSLFNQYRSDRVMQEQRWLRNLRQYLGLYDPEVEKFLADDRSKAYPKITRVKCISLLSRIMDLMFPSDDRNWTLKARPSPDMDIKDVKQAVQDAIARDKAADSSGNGPQIDDDYVMQAVTELAQKRADDLVTEILDQLQEIGGDQSYDYVALNKEVVASAILFGVGVMQGPSARRVTTASWIWDEKTQQPKAKTKTAYMPHFETVRVWDFYPDMSAKRLAEGDGYFIRKVLSKSALRDLADREDFFGDTIKSYLNGFRQGNYRPQNFESELRSMGVKNIVNEQKAETSKYEVIIWHGPVSGEFLELAGVEIPPDKIAAQIQAEVWTIGDYVIKADMNPWIELGQDVKTIHTFVFDQDEHLGRGLRPAERHARQPDGDLGRDPHDDGQRLGGLRADPRGERHLHEGRPGHADDPRLQDVPPR